MYDHRSPAEAIFGAVKDNNGIFLNNILKSMPPDLYSSPPV
jgi:hypothetical protein